MSIATTVILALAVASASACNSETSGAFSVHTDRRSASVDDIDGAVVMWNEHTERRGRGAAGPSMSFDCTNRGFVAVDAFHVDDGAFSVVVGANESDSAVVVGHRTTGRSLMLVRTGGVTTVSFYAQGFPDDAVIRKTAFLAEEEPLALPANDAVRRAQQTTCAAARNGGGQFVVRVLVVVTPQAAATESITDISLRVHAAFAEANAVVFPQSHANVRLELAFGDVVNDTTLETQAPGTTLHAIHTSPLVAGMRRSFAADLVVAYTTLAAMGNRACGIGYMFPGTTSAVAAQCFLENYSMLHEVIGHGSGACHYGCAMGANGFTDGGKTFRTIMAYPNTCDGCTRVARFSCSDADCRYNSQRIGDFAHKTVWLINQRARGLSTNNC